VFLKEGGKYCGVSAKGEMQCSNGGPKGIFAFKHPANSCTGTAKLLSLPSGQPAACRFAADAPAPQVACAIIVGGPPAEIVISNNPIATSRSGEVAFEFRSVENVGVTSRAPSNSFTVGTQSILLQCNTGGIRALTSRRWGQVNRGRDAAKENRDLEFKLRCSDLAGSGTLTRYSWSGWGALDFTTFVCPQNKILSSIESRYKETGRMRKTYQRQYKYTCNDLPKGVIMSVGAYGGWLHGSNPWGERTLDCGESGFIVGVKGMLNSEAGPDAAYVCGTVSVSKPPPLTFEVEYSHELLTALP
jgi:hypothetical protein